MSWLPSGRGRNAALAFLVGLTAVACNEKDVKVTSLTFTGNHAVTSAELQRVLATKASGGLPWSESQYFDRAEFETDLNRIRRFYQDAGYPDARITGVDIAFNEKRTSVRLAIVIDEGEPIIAEDVRFTGFEVLEEGARAALDAAPLKSGQPRNRHQVAASRQAGIDLLRNNGYAYGDVRVTEEPGTAPKRVVVAFAAVPGPATVFGPISYVGLSSLSERVVGRQLSFAPGQPYRQNRVLGSQRRLSSFAILQFVNIDARPPEGTTLTEVPVTVTVTENPPRRLELGAGYGSEDHFRSSASWSHLNFLGNGRQVSSTAKWSSIDRGLRLNLTQPYFYVRGLGLDASATTWWTNEETYSSYTYGGRIGVHHRFAPRERGPRRVPADVVRASYVYEYLGYGITPEALADPENWDDFIALGLDPVTGEGRGTKTAVALSYERNRSNDVLDPRRGYVLSLQDEIARPGLGGTFRYSEYLVEGRGYLPLGDRLVVAGRGRAGFLQAQDDASVPFSER